LLQQNFKERLQKVREKTMKWLDFPWIFSGFSFGGFGQKWTKMGKMDKNAPKIPRHSSG